MAQLIYPFDTDVTPSLSEVGGKSLSLIRTTSAGLPVPGGLALTVAFFDAWTEKIKSTPEWDALLENPDKERCDEVKKLAAKLSFGDLQRTELERCLAELPPGDVFAVRSSSPEEDLSGLSFAGMYETFLGVTRKSLEKIIAHAYSSMFDVRVMAYKAQNGMPLEGSRISVIVQRQIASDVSGVGFSLNPLNNCYDEVVIDASFGLGEAIVTGIVTPDHYVVEKVTMEILEDTVSDKKIALNLKNDGGIEQHDNPDPHARALSHSQILELTELIKQTEAYYGFPVDTEWAYEKDKLFLLQARPITTHVPLYEEMVTPPGEQKKLYLDVMPLTQGFDDALSVLGGDIWKIVMDSAKRGAMPTGDGGYVLNVHGRQYMQLHNMFRGVGKKALAGLLTYDNALEGREEEIFAEYVSSEMSPLMKQARSAQIKMGLGLLPVLIKLLWSVPAAVQRTDRAVNQLTEFFGSLKNDRPFDEVVESAFAGFDARYFDLTPSFAGMLADRKLRKMMKGTAGEELTGFALMDVSSNPTSAMGHAMFELARAPELRETRDGAEFERRIVARDYSNEFLAAFDDYLTRYGERGFREIDVASPRLMERLPGFHEQLSSMNVESNQLLEVAGRKTDAVEKMRAIAAEKGKQKAFDKALQTIDLTYGHRETPKNIFVVLIGNLHRLALEIGERFVSEGRLDRPEQIFDLRIAQIAAAQSDHSLQLRALVEANLEPRQLMAGVTQFPSFIDSRGKIFRRIVEPKDGELAGMAVSNGTYKGRAKVLLSPYEKPLEPGDILVTVATEPSWTPVFVNASAVVLEVGGGLQHGAIIAREYGLPCVSGLPGVTEMIKDGDLLEVDGTNGIVRVVEEAT